MTGHLGLGLLNLFSRIAFGYREAYLMPHAKVSTSMYVSLNGGLVNQKPEYGRVQRGKPQEQGIVRREGSFQIRHCLVNSVSAIVLASTIILESTFLGYSISRSWPINLHSKSASLASSHHIWDLATLFFLMVSIDQLRRYLCIMLIGAIFGLIIRGADQLMNWCWCCALILCSNPLEQSVYFWASLPPGASRVVLESGFSTIPRTWQCPRRHGNIRCLLYNEIVILQTIFDLTLVVAIFETTPTTTRTASRQESPIKEPLLVVPYPVYWTNK